MGLRFLSLKIQTIRHRHIFDLGEDDEKAPELGAPGLWPWSLPTKQGPAGPAGNLQVDRYYHPD